MDGGPEMLDDPSGRGASSGRHPDGLEPDGSTPRVTGPSRRRLLLAGGGVAATVWATPAITRVAAAAACSMPCTPVPLNLNAAPFANVGNNQEGSNIVARSWVVRQNPAGNTGSVVTTITAAQEGGQAPISNGGDRTGWIRNEVFGNIRGYIPIARRGRLSPQWAQLTLNFNPAVYGLRFTLVDIDSDDGAAVSYREQAVVSWAPAATPAPAYTWGTQIANTAPNTFDQISSTFNAGATDPAANVTVVFDACDPVSSITIHSNDLNPNVATGNQDAGRSIGIAGISFCRG